MNLYKLRVISIYSLFRSFSVIYLLSLLFDFCILNRKKYIRIYQRQKKNKIKFLCTHCTNFGHTHCHCHLSSSLVVGICTTAHLYQGWVIKMTTQNGTF